MGVIVEKFVKHGLGIVHLLILRSLITMQIGSKKPVYLSRPQIINEICSYKTRPETAQTFITKLRELQLIKLLKDDPNIPDDKERPQKFIIDQEGFEKHFEMKPEELVKLLPEKEEDLFILFNNGAPNILEDPVIKDYLAFSQNTPVEEKAKTSIWIDTHPEHVKRLIQIRIQRMDRKQRQQLNQYMKQLVEKP